MSFPKEWPLKFSWKRLIVAVAFAFLVFLNVLMEVYVYANITDWKIDLLNINPSEKTNERHFPVMTFPPSEGSGFYIGNPNNTMIFEHMSLKYAGTLAENRPVEMSVIGTLSPEFAEKIDSVHVYFEGALPYPLSSGTYSAGWGISLHPTLNEQATDISLGAFLIGEPTIITWQVQGEYYPSITIFFKNFSQTLQSYERHKDFSVYISASDLIEQQKTNRINTSISVAVLFFAFVDGGSLVGHWVSGRKNQNYDSNQPAKKPESKSHNRQTASKGKRERLKPHEKRKLK